MRLFFVIYFFLAFSDFSFAKKDCNFISLTHKQKLEFSEKMDEIIENNFKKYFDEKNIFFEEKRLETGVSLLFRPNFDDYGITVDIFFVGKSSNGILYSTHGKDLIDQMSLHETGIGPDFIVDSERSPNGQIKKICRIYSGHPHITIYSLVEEYGRMGEMIFDSQKILEFEI